MSIVGLKALVGSECIPSLLIFDVERHESAFNIIQCEIFSKTKY